MPTYLGFDVLEIEPDPDHDMVHSRSLFRVDAGIGKIRTGDRTGVPQVGVRPFRWLMDGRAEVADYWTFRDARAGRLVPFWVPTWRHDFQLREDILTTGNTLVVERTGYTSQMFPHRARKYLAIFTPGAAARYYRKVTAAVDQPGLGQETLTLNSNLPENVPRAGSMVSFLTLVRMAVDDLELAWHSRDVAEALLDLIEVPQEVPA